MLNKSNDDKEAITPRKKPKNIEDEETKKNRTINVLQTYQSATMSY